MAIKDTVQSLMEAQLAAMPPEKRARAEEAIARARARAQTPEYQAERAEVLKAIEEERRSGDKDSGEFVTMGEALVMPRFLGKLREERERQGLSLTDMAEKCGIDKPALSRLENCHTNPTIDTLARYLRALGKRLVLDFEDNLDAE
jgi:ribosome-binding protein aMBF1 (putative translation factor)